MDDVKNLEKLLKEATASKDKAQEDVDSVKKQMDLLQEQTGQQRQRGVELLQKAIAIDNVLSEGDEDAMALFASYYAVVEQFVSKVLTHTIKSATTKFLVYGRPNGPEEATTKFAGFLVDRLDGNNVSEAELRGFVIGTYAEQCCLIHDKCVAAARDGKLSKVEDISSIEERTRKIITRYGATESDLEAVSEITKVFSDRMQLICDYAAATGEVEKVRSELSNLEIQLSSVERKYNKRRDGLHNAVKSEGEYRAKIEAYRTKINDEREQIGNRLEQLEQIRQAHPKHQQIQAAYDLTYAIVDKIFGNGTKKPPQTLLELTGLQNYMLDPSNPRDITEARKIILNAISRPDGSYDADRLSKIIYASKTGYNPEDVVIGLGCLDENQCFNLHAQNEFVIRLADTMPVPKTF